MLAPPFGVSPLASSVKGKAFSLTLCSVKASLAVQVSLFFSPRPGGFYLLVASTLRLGHCAATKCPRMLVRNMCSLKGENGRLAHYRQFFFFSSESVEHSFKLSITEIAGSGVVLILAGLEHVPCWIPACLGCGRGIFQDCTSNPWGTVP